MLNEITLSVLIGVLIIGGIQHSEASQETSRITVDEKEFQQPSSKYDYQQITITGHIVDYARGGNVSVVMINPNESEEEINTFATKDGDVYTLIQITEDAKIGTHHLILMYHGEEVAHTSFEILEN
jgi:hypothetical protein